ncbi:MAG: BtaA family protein [Gammaproteobacteria bacterium]|nr:BtaA family protein [Gammaproteobacteria bacterium]
MNKEIRQRADFSFIRYAQCWEDADVLNAALQVRPGDTCLSIASAGDNSLSLLTNSPARVVAVDLNPAQLACLQLRIAAYRALSHAELLGLMGSRPHPQRNALYRRCRPLLSRQAREFWDARAGSIARGIGGAGRFEHYFELFRTRVLPLIHRRARIDELLVPRERTERENFYQRKWNTRRWRLLFRLFFSRFVMGRLGRDPSFFDYVEGSVAERILQRTRHALVELDPAQNPYLQWILTGTHTSALPRSLREEHFAAIRDNIERIEWHCISIEEYLANNPDIKIDCFNLSDIFEYMSQPGYEKLLEILVAHARPGARLAYWNMLAPRSRPPSMADRLISEEQMAAQLHRRDKAFFYSRFILEAVRP